MSHKVGELPKLPERAISLGLELSFSLSQLASLERGYESQNQDEKWSIYFRDPWVQIWRPSRRGVYCYAVRFEKVDDQRVRMVESWIGDKVIDSFGSDLVCHREIVAFVLESVAGVSCEALKELGTQFKYQLVSGRRHPKLVTFHGEATNIDEVNEIAKALRVEVAQMLKDRC